MRLANELSVRRVAQDGDAPPACEVVVSGVATGRRVAGAVLEAAVEHEGEYLLFLTDDVPFEDMLSIHLVDAQGRLLDTARIGAMYSTGAFSGLALREPGVAGIRFIGDTEWTVQVFPEAKMQVPFVSDAPGVTRPLALRRRFRVHGDPRPAD
jgi:hypothetical protein